MISTQTCPLCQTVNKPEAKFCHRCGAPLSTVVPAQSKLPFNHSAGLTVRCPHCHKMNRSIARFCQGCGTELNPAASSQLPARGHNFRTWASNHREIVIGVAIGLGIFCILVISLLGINEYLKRSINKGYQSVATIIPIPSLQPGVVKTIEAVPTVLATLGSLPTLLSTTSPLETLAPTLISGVDLKIPHLSDQEEIDIGDQTAAEFEKNYVLSSDAAGTERITNIGEKILPHQPRVNIPFVFKLLETDEINAFALPGGHIYVTRGILDFVANDTELAGVIGHEIAHVALRHGAQQIEAMAAAEAALEALATSQPDFNQIYQNQGAQFAAQLAAQIVFTGWGREAELEADEFGTRYIFAAGFDPQAYVDLLRRLGNLLDAPNDPVSQLLATHPPFEDRIARVEQTIKEIK